MITDNRFVIGSILLAFIFFNCLAYVYTSHYGIPFGMSDIDRYLCFWGRPTIWEECPKVNIVFIMTHFYTFFMSAGLDMQQLNYAVNMYVWLVVPVCFYIFSREFLDNKDAAIHTTFYLMFATYIYFFFGMMLLLAQLSAFIFYLLSMAFFTKGDYKKGFILCFMACLGHPYIVIIFLLYFFSHGLFHKKHTLIFGTFVGMVFFLFFFGIENFTVFFSNRPQPTLYDVFFIFTNPLLTFFFLVGVGIKKHDVNHIFMLLLLVIAPFSYLSRAYPYLLVLMVNYAYMGLRHIMKNTMPGRYLDVVFLLFIFLHFGYMFHYFNQNMLVEMPLRGLNPNYYMNMLGLNNS